MSQNATYYSDYIFTHDSNFQKNALEAIPKVMARVSLFLLSMILGCAVSMFFMPPILSFIPALIVSFVLLLAIYRKSTTANSSGDLHTLNLLYFSLFFFLGYDLYPLIATFLFTIPNGPLLLVIALLSTFAITVSTITSIVFLQQSSLTIATSQTVLTNLLLCSIAVVLLNIFLQIPLLLLIEGVIGALLFTIFLLIDIVSFILQNKSQFNGSCNHVRSEVNLNYAATNIALDIANIFINIFKILVELKSEKKNTVDFKPLLKILSTFVVGTLVVMGLASLISTDIEVSANGNNRVDATDIKQDKFHSKAAGFKDISPSAPPLQPELK